MAVHETEKYIVKKGIIVLTKLEDFGALVDADVNAQSTIAGLRGVVQNATEFHQTETARPRRVGAESLDQLEDIGALADADVAAQTTVSGLIGAIRTRAGVTAAETPTFNDGSDWYNGNLSTL